MSPLTSSTYSRIWDNVWCSHRHSSHSGNAFQGPNILQEGSSESFSWKDPVIYYHFCIILTPKKDTIKRWSLWEVLGHVSTNLMNWISAFLNEVTESLIVFYTLWVNRNAIEMNQEENPHQLWPCWWLNLLLLSSELWKMNVCCL